MTYVGDTEILTFNFGAAHAGLSSVGYQFYAADGQPYLARQTNVVALGNGSYQGSHVWSAPWVGSVRGDTGQLEPVYTDAASIVVIPRPPTDLQDLIDRLDDIEAQLALLPLVRTPA